MKLPRVRVTVRRLMIAVAVAGAGLGLLAESRSCFLRLSEHHGAMAGTMVVGTPTEWSGTGYAPIHFADPEGRVVPLPRSRWHRQVAAVYRAASDRPWFPTDPLLPEPE
jgi:hypothetical protein